MLLDVSKYADQIERRRARRSLAAQLSPNANVPICFYFNGAFYCELLGVDVEEYYREPELQVEVQLKGWQWQMEHLRADSSTCDWIGFETGPIGEAVAFGTPIFTSQNSPPVSQSIENDLSEILKLQVIPPDRNRLWQSLQAKAERFAARASKLGTNIPVAKFRPPAIHLPLTATCLLADATQVMLAVGGRTPELDKVLWHMCHALIEWNAYFYGNGEMWLCDDYICFISEADFRACLTKHYQFLNTVYSDRRLCFHADGPLDQHFAHLLDFVSAKKVDIGGFSSLVEERRHLQGRVLFSGGLNNKDFDKHGLHQTTIKKALQAIEDSKAEGGFELSIGGQCYVGVNPDSLCQLVEIVRSEYNYAIE